MDEIELQQALDPSAAKARLVRKFGTTEAALLGNVFHNAYHGYEVATAADLLARVLYEARRLRWEAVLLAPYAGWCHDGEQGEGHELRSAGIAAAEMRRRGIPERHVATVDKMIMATRARIKGHLIVQAADPNDPEEALLADADLSHLGRKGVYRGLQFGLELQHRLGLIKLPSPTDGTEVEPDPDFAIGYLRAQERLYDEHKYLLDITPRIFIHQKANRDEIGRMRQLYEAGRISYSEMLADAKRRAMS